MPKDASFTHSLMEKVSYMWHILKPKVFDKNYSVIYIFNKFMNDKKKAKDLFEVFVKKYSLELTDEENLKYTFKENQDIQLDFALNSYPEIELENKNVNELVLESSIYEGKQELSDQNPEVIVRNYSHEYHSNISKKSLTIELGEVQKVEPIYTHSHLMNTNRGNHMTLEMEVKIKKKEKDALEVNQLLPLGDFDHPEFPSIHSISLNYVVEELVQPDSSHVPEKKRCKQDIEKILNKISLKKESLQKFFANDNELYYYKIFGFVEKHLNEEKKSEFEELKFSVLDSIYGIPPKFPTVKFIPINQVMLKIF